MTAALGNGHIQQRQHAEEALASGVMNEDTDNESVNQAVIGTMAHAAELSTNVREFERVG
jgi:hypothetical protein